MQSIYTETNLQRNYTRIAVASHVYGMLKITLSHFQCNSFSFTSCSLLKVIDEIFMQHNRIQVSKHSDQQYDDVFETNVSQSPSYTKSMECSDIKFGRRFKDSFSFIANGILLLKPYRRRLTCY